MFWAVYNKVNARNNINASLYPLTLAVFMHNCPTEACGASAVCKPFKFNMRRSSHAGISILRTSPLMQQFHHAKTHKSKTSEVEHPCVKAIFFFCAQVLFGGLIVPNPVKTKTVKTFLNDKSNLFPHSVLTADQNPNIT